MLLMKRKLHYDYENAPEINFDPELFGSNLHFFRSIMMITTLVNYTLLN